MARKKPTAAEPETPTERVLPDQVLKSISRKKLKDLLAAARSTKQDVDEIVGTHREQIAEAVEKHNLHKGAFAMCKRLDRLEPGKLADWLDYLQHYLDISGLYDRAATAPRLEMGDAAGETADNDDDAEKDAEPEPAPSRGRGTVTRFPAAAE